MNDNFLMAWMTVERPEPEARELVVLKERPGGRNAVEAAIGDCVMDHLAGLEIIARVGSHKKALAYIQNKLPETKKVRSGDFGEILASEYISQLTEFEVPIKRLRWKDDRNVPMRGNDVVAIRKSQDRWRLLKAEAKSRENLGSSTIQEAVEDLEKHGGRPNPSSLAFISARLREQNRDGDAAVIEDFQLRAPKPSDIEHLVFTLSGNDPTTHLKTGLGKGLAIRRNMVGCIIADHQPFIKTVFERIHAGKRRRNHRTA
jgi:HamA